MDALKLHQSMIPLERQIAAVKAEIGMRKHFYPKWTASGKMKPETAASNIEAMEAVLKTLEDLKVERESKVNPALPF